VKGSCEHGSETWGFHEVLRSSWAALQLEVSHEGLSSMEVVGLFHGTEGNSVKTGSFTKIYTA
jgi:hypothetical protein